MELLKLIKADHLDSGDHVRKLLKNRHLKTQDACEAFQLAAGLNRVNCMREVYKYFKAIDRPGKKEMTALHYAAKYNAIRAAKYLIKLGSYVNTQDIYGNTPLKLALTRGHVSMAKVLIHAGGTGGTGGTGGGTGVSLPESSNLKSLKL